MLLQEQMKINRFVEGCDGNPFFVKRVNFESALRVNGCALNFLCKLNKNLKIKKIEILVTHHKQLIKRNKIQLKKRKW